MEPIFENRIKMTKEVYFQFISRALRLTSRIFMFIGVFILAVSLISLTVTELSSMLVGSIVFAAIMVFLSVFNARFSANRVYKQQLVMHGQEPENTVRFTDTIQGFGSNKGESTYQYSQITKIYETKDLMMLMLGKLVAIPLKKDGFTIGSYEGFKTFIKEKCPDVKTTK